MDFLKVLVIVPTKNMLGGRTMVPCRGRTTKRGNLHCQHPGSNFHVLAIPSSRAHLTPIATKSLDLIVADDDMIWDGRASNDNAIEQRNISRDLRKHVHRRISGLTHWQPAYACFEILSSARVCFLPRRACRNPSPKLRKFAKLIEQKTDEN